MNGKDRNKGTPLLRAAGAGRLVAVKQLLAAQADVLCRDSSQEPLAWATGRLGELRNVFHIAINNQHLEMCQVLFERPSTCDRSPFVASGDESERLMVQENEEGKTAAQMLLELPPEVRAAWA